MFEKVSPLFQLFEKQFNEAQALQSSLGKNFRSKKALELEDKLIFFNVYLHVLNKIHFNEERLKFESFSGFKSLCRSLKRIHHYKLASTAFEEEKAKTVYAGYEAFLNTEKKSLYKEVHELIMSLPQDIWEPLYATAYNYSRKISPLMLDTAAGQLINEELEYINVEGRDALDGQAMRDIMEALQVITVVENLKIAVGLNPVYTEGIHQEMKELLRVLTRWNQSYFFAQHLNHFLSDNEHVGNKYLELAKRMRTKKKRLAVEAANLYIELFSKL